MAFHTTRILSKGRAAPKMVLHIDFLLLLGHRALRWR